VKGLKIGVLSLAAFVLGCGGVSFLQFNPQGDSVRTIALLTVPNPTQYQTVDWGGKAGFFGAVGGVAIQADARTMTEAFTTAVKAGNFDFSREMQAAVVERLKRSGFNVVVVRAEREAPEKLLSDYGKVPSPGADALLDIDARVVGYSTYNIQDPEFRPHIYVDVRLVSAKTKAVLYSEQILFGYHNPYLSATQLPSEKQYYFKDFSVLMANKARAFEGLRRGTDAVAGHIAKRLKGQ